MNSLGTLHSYSNNKKSPVAGVTQWCFCSKLSAIALEKNSITFSRNIYLHCVKSKQQFERTVDLYLSIPVYTKNQNLKISLDS